jgi:hypothetical protein
MVAQACNLATREAEIGRIMDEARVCKKKTVHKTPLQQKKLGMVACTCYLSYNKEA